MESHKTNVLKWGMFMASSMKAAIHLGPDFLKNSKIYKNTRFENVFNIIEKLMKNILEKYWMWDPWIIHHHHGRNQHWSTIRRSSGRRQKLVSTQIPFYVVVGWNKHQSRRRKMERPSWRCEEVFLVPRRSWTRRRSNWTRVEKFPRIFYIDDSSRDPESLETKNIKQEDFKDRILFMSMFNDIDWKKNDEHCISHAEEVRNYPMKFMHGHWTFLGPGSEEKWYGDTIKKGNGIVQPTKW